MTDFQIGKIRLSKEGWPPHPGLTSLTMTAPSKPAPYIRCIHLLIRILRDRDVFELMDEDDQKELLELTGEYR